MLFALGFCFGFTACYLALFLASQISHFLAGIAALLYLPFL
jgi:hypothetical protein